MDPPEPFQTFWRRWWVLIVWVAVLAAIPISLWAFGQPARDSDDVTRDDSWRSWWWGVALRCAFPVWLFPLFYTGVRYTDQTTKLWTILLGVVAAFASLVATALVSSLLNPP